MRGVSKRFGGTHALRDARIEVGPGEIVALLGENGAGKSTLIKILAGIHSPDAGTVTYRGREATHSVRHLPIAFLHQDLGLIEWMTVAENISLMLGFPKRLGLIDWSAVRARASRALDAVGADIDPDVRVHDLTRTEKSLVAIARALAADAEILVLDEPTASLPTNEVSRMFTALRRLRSRGVGMIYVSHRLDEVFEIADRMVILRDGRVVGERAVSGTTAEDVIFLIVGREPAQVFRRPPAAKGAARLVLEQVMIGDGDAGPLDCRIRAGEVVGFVGLRGAGQESVGRALFGLTPVTGGRISLDGRTVTARSPREAMDLGINLVCADRFAESVVAGLSIRENLFLNPVAAGRRLLSYVDPDAESRAAVELGHRIGLRPNDCSVPIDWLSGGNQQKVVVGRWLHLEGSVYVLEDPTAGVDVGAKAEIYRLFDLVIQRGGTILIVSTDFEEIAEICHRALVFDRGRVVAELAGDDLCVENLLGAASARVGHSTGTPPCNP